MSSSFLEWRDGGGGGEGISDMIWGTLRRTSLRSRPAVNPPKTLVSQVDMSYRGRNKSDLRKTDERYLERKAKIKSHMFNGQSCTHTGYSFSFGGGVYWSCWEIDDSWPLLNCVSVCVLYETIAMAMTFQPIGSSVFFFNGTLRARMPKQLFKTALKTLPFKINK